METSEVVVRQQVDVIIEREISRQAEFGMYPSLKDLQIALVGIAKVFPVEPEDKNPAMDPSLADTQEMPAVVEHAYVADVVAEGLPNDLPMPPGGFMPEDPVSIPPRPGTEPITRIPRKLSRREQEIEKRRRSDPLGSDRSDIDYGSDELPSVR